jgi:hypothetical protein
VTGLRLLALISFSLCWAALFYVLCSMLIWNIEAIWLRVILLLVVIILGVAVYASGYAAILKKRVR